MYKHTLGERWEKLQRGPAQGRGNTARPTRALLLVVLEHDGCKALVYVGRIWGAYGVFMGCLEVC